MSARTDIRLRKAEKILDIAYADGARFAPPCGSLRVQTPSAPGQAQWPRTHVLHSGLCHGWMFGV